MAKRVKDSYKISDNSEDVKKEAVKDAFGLRSWLYKVFIEPLKEVKKKQDLGLSQNFDPDRTYDVTSQTGSIKNWKDFFVVYVVMIVAILAIISLLAYFEYIENPITRFTDESADSATTSEQVTDEKDEVDLLVEEYREEDLESGIFEVEMDADPENSIIYGSDFINGQARGGVRKVGVQILSGDLVLASSTIQLASESDEEWISFTLPISLEGYPSSSDAQVRFFSVNDPTIEQFFDVELSQFENGNVALLTPVSGTVIDRGTFVVRGQVSVADSAQRAYIKILDQDKEMLRDFEYELKEFFVGGDQVDLSESMDIIQPQEAVNGFVEIGYVAGEVYTEVALIPVKFLDTPGI